MAINNKQKSIGIITMHKVHNYGSALQAYALQRIISKLGFDCELIDYIYPNDYHYNQNTNKRPKKTLRYCIKQLILGFPGMRMNKRFREFYKNFFHLSLHTYHSMQEIKNNPPIYDIYVTGSDQVWNPRFVKEDTTFMLSFVPSSAYKISYASSFSIDKLDNKFVKLYSRYLLEYASISVREKNGADIIKNILSRDAEVVLDPTLLLTPEEWNEITPSLEIEEPYILVYLMGYVFDPFPYAYELIEKVRKETGYKKVKIFGHSISKGRNPLYKVIRQAGPLEFIRLFSNASFVITSSFHGTAFALIFSKPFFSLVNDKQSGDDRQLNLLREVKAEDRAIKMNSDLANLQLEYDKLKITKNLSELRNRSIDYLKRSLMVND